MILPQRKSNRYKEYDYSTEGYYFITICTFGKHHTFGTVQNGGVSLNKIGNIALSNIQQIHEHFKNVKTDKFIVMPNHIHMIVIVLPNEERSINSSDIWYQRSKQLIPRVVQVYKSSVTRMTSISNLWQSGYYDHVIRTEEDYFRIWDYIDSNPAKWDSDEYYKENLS